MNVKKKRVGDFGRKRYAGHDHSVTDLKQWTLLLNRSLHERLSADTFNRYAKALAAAAPRLPAPSSQSPASRDIVGALLRTQTRRSDGSIAALSFSSGIGADPLLVAYAGRLLRLGVVHGYDLLGALLATSSVGTEAGDAAGNANSNDDAQTTMVPLEVTEAMLGLLAARYGAQELLAGTAEVRKTMSAAADWMGALAAADHKAMMQDIDINMTEVGERNVAEAGVLREVVGRVVVALAMHPAIARVLSTGGAISSDAAKRLGEAITGFIPLLSAVSMQLADRLDQFRRDHEGLWQLPEGQSGFDRMSGNTTNAGEIQVGNIVDRPVARSRASPVVYLDALLGDPPRVNDDTLLAYLQLRSKGDSDSSIVELITASFELLAVASIRGDTPNKTFLHRAFVVNKVPILMTSLARMAYMAPNFTVLITQAFGRLTSTGFPSYNAGFGVAPNESLLTDTKRDFLVACVLHGHIRKDDIKEFTDEDLIPSLPAGGLATREGLFAEYQKAPQKLEQLVSGLEAMDGNAGAAAEAVVQIMHSLCSSRNTMALKNLCHAMSSKPHAIDTMFLFRDSVHILNPLCEVFNGWKYDDDQGEYQPVYEEFSSCLLFLLACMHRFKLGAADLGGQSENDFLTWVINQSQSTQPIKELSEEQNKQLAGWARGLFELEGISDDVMSICPPQDFYKLVPTVFEQSLLSRRLEVITLKALENGIELLFELFLLPCVVFGTRYLANQAWIRGDGASAILQMMQKFIRSTSKTGQDLALHKSALSMVQLELQNILGELRHNKMLKQQDVDALKEQVDAYAPYSRSPTIPLKDANTSATAQAEERASIPNTLSELRNTFDKLCSWSIPASLMPSVPSYSHTRDVLLPIEANGATRVIRALVDSLAAHAEADVGDVALDVAIALVCADDAANNAAAPSSSAISLTLRQALQLERDNAPAKIAQEPLKTEMAVLLHRQVEAQLAALHNAATNVDAAQDPLQSMPLGISMDMPIEMPQNMNSVDMGGINMDDLDMGMNMNVNMNMNMNMMGMDGLEMNSLGGAGASAADGGTGLTVQAQAQPQPLDGFGESGGDGSTQTAEQQAMQDESSTFDLALDTSFGGNAEDDEDGRRTSVEDIWSGLDF